MHPRSNQKNAKATKQITGLLHSQHTQERMVRSTNYPGRETRIHYTEKLPHNSAVRLATAKTKPKTIAGKELYTLLRL